jgi:hypothetical protein
MSELILEGFAAGTHGRNQSAGTDQVHLQGEDAEEQVAIGGEAVRLGHELTFLRDPR